MLQKICQSVAYCLCVDGCWYKRAGNQQTYGLFVGDDTDVFDEAASLSLEVNFEMVEEPLKKVLVWLDPTEFKSTWLGNKSIYRTRMAIADGGELIVLAPALKEFGEDKEIDRLIRKYGYHGTPAALKAVAENEELRNNLSAAAHLIHGSSEGRFTITYCPGKNSENLSKEEIEGVGFQWADIEEMMKHYRFNELKEGYNTYPMVRKFILSPIPPWDYGHIKIGLNIDLQMIYFQVMMDNTFFLNILL